MSMKVNRFQLLQTVVETSTILTNWANYLSREYYLEFGSDPQLVTKIERDIEKLANRIFDLDHQFEIEKTPVRNVNTYFTATNRLENTIAFIKEIRRQAYGTQQNTQNCIQHLNLCIQGLHEVGQTIQPGFSHIKH